MPVDFEFHKQYWRYFNRGWKLASEAKIKLDRKNRRLTIYLAFVRKSKSTSLEAIYLLMLMRTTLLCWLMVLPISSRLMWRSSS